MDADELALQQSAVRHIANKLKIEDTDFKSVNELLGEIQQRDVQSRGLLTDFMDAHLDWHHFHEKSRLAGKPADQEQLTKFVARRDATRAAIVARARELDKK